MKMMRVLILSFCVVLMLVACDGSPNPGESHLVAGVVDDVAQAGAPPTLLDAVKLLAAGVTGGVVSFLFERMNWFGKLSANGKWWLTFSLMVGLPILAQGAVKFVPAEVWDGLQPFWNSLALGFTAWLGSQLIHKADLLVAAAVTLLKGLSGD